MITKNEKYGISSGVTIAAFGGGDIIVSDAMIENKIGALMLSNDVQNPIGTDHPDRVGKSTDDLLVDVIFTFNKVESVDVVLKALETVKRQMLGVSSEQKKELSKITDEHFTEMAKAAFYHPDKEVNVDPEEIFIEHITRGKGTIGAHISCRCFEGTIALTFDGVIGITDDEDETAFLAYPFKAYQYLSQFYLMPVFYPENKTEGREEK